MHILCTDKIENNGSKSKTWCATAELPYTKGFYDTILNGSPNYGYQG